MTFSVICKKIINSIENKQEIKFILSPVIKTEAMNMNKVNKQIKF